MTNEIIKIVPGIMAAGVALNALKVVPKMKMNRKGVMKIKPVSSKKLVKVGVQTIVGTALVGATASMINKL